MLYTLQHTARTGEIVMLHRKCNEPFSIQAFINPEVLFEEGVGKVMVSTKVSAFCGEDLFAFLEVHHTVRLNDVNPDKEWLRKAFGMMINHHREMWELHYGAFPIGEMTREIIPFRFENFENAIDTAASQWENVL